MKILIIRFSSIGDIVLTSPVVRCIYQQIAGVEIHYLTKFAYRDIIASNPYITRKIYVKDDLTTVQKELKKERYDFILDLHNSMRSFLVRCKLGRPSDVVNKLNIEKWLYVNFKWKVLPDIHIVDRYLEPVRKLGVLNDGKGLDYFIPSADYIKADHLPLTHIHGYVALVIGARHATKKLPLWKLQRLCSLLPLPVILIGGPEDTADGLILSAADPVKIYNGCGKYSLNQSASLVKQAKYVITHDTGFMHIAAAFKKKIISIWGNTVPELGMYPYFGNDHMEPGIVENKELNCRPCSKIGFEKCPKGHFNCMNQLEEERIIAISNTF